MEKHEQNGIGFCGLLTIVFVVLKLTNVIAWSWIWVVAPLWLPVVIVIAAIFAAFIGFAAYECFKAVRK